MLTFPRETPCGGHTWASTTWTSAPWMVIVARRTTCAVSRKRGCCRRRRRNSTAASLALRAQDLPYITVNTCRIASGIVHQFQPTFVSVVELGLAEQVGRLHDRLNRVAQVMRQTTKLGD